jgi:hypothetical protein
VMRAAVSTAFDGVGDPGRGHPCRYCPGNQREHHGEFIWAAAALAEVGKLEPRADPSEYVLSEVGTSHEAVESATAAKKVVIALG